MDAQATARIPRPFEQIPDPRRMNRRHQLIDILTIAQQQVYEPGIVGRTIDLVEGFVRDGTLSEDRIDESYARIMALKGR